jgi:small subunit ribosomal protein S2
MANKVEVKELLEAGVHFGHMTRKWDPNMAIYLYGKKWYPHYQFIQNCS